MADEKHPGGIGTYTIYSEKTIPSRFMKKDEAVRCVKEKYNIDKDADVQVKAVYVPVRDTFQRVDWGWAVKVDKPVKVKTAANSELDANLFWVNPRVFQIEKAKKRSMETDWLKDRMKIAILTEDVFTKDTRNVSKDGIRRPGLCKLIPVENVIQ